MRLSDSNLSEPEGRPAPILASIIQALRPHQWSKNILLPVPLVTSQRIFQTGQFRAELIGIVCFSLAASGVYILNDLVDRESDRRHPTKRTRPFASGRLSVGTGIVLMILLVGISLSLAILTLPPYFLLMLVSYFVVTTLYTFWLKRKMIVDVICLAGLYTLRILAGGAAAEIPISPWLMAFSMFLFLSLAFAKRFAEIALLKNGASNTGRGYIDTDLDLIRAVGPSSGTLSVMVLCLYLNSPEVLELYIHPRRLWFLCPLLLYWILRIWFITHREALRDDPVLFAIKDRVSWLVALMALVVVFSATIL